MPLVSLVTLVAWRSEAFGKEFSIQTEPKRVSMRSAR